jgi:hypothetical protein
MASEKVQTPAPAQKISLEEGMKNLGHFTKRDLEIDTLMENLKDEKNKNAEASQATREALIKEYPFIEPSLVKLEIKKSPGRPRKNTDDDDDAAAQLPEGTVTATSKVPVEA